MEIIVGDRIKLIKEIGEGKVSKIISENEVEVLIDGFECIYNIEELIVITNSNHVKSFAKPKIILKEATKIKTANIKTKATELVLELRGYKIDNNSVCIDLHLNYLLDFYPKIKNETILEFQMAYFKKAVLFLLEKSYKQLTVIHGFGKGKLRENIYNYIENNYTQFEIFGADTEKFGLFGASVISRKRKN